MSFSFTARLEEDELRRLLDQLLPATVDLSEPGEDPGQRFIRVEKAHHVDFEAGRGLRLKTSAKARFKAAGLSIPSTVNELDLLVRPVIAIDGDGPKVAFRPTIEHADFHLLPGFVDSAITARLNAALEAAGDKLAWHFGRALRRSFGLHTRLSPIESVRIEAAGGTVDVEDRAFVLRIDLALNFDRGSESD